MIEPLDSWPKEGDSFWSINTYGEIANDIWTKSYKQKFLGCYETKQEAEYAAERIRSIGEVEDISIGESLADSSFPDSIFVEIRVPKKYLKAWQSLSEESK